MKLLTSILLGILISGSVTLGEELKTELTASKDTFCRSNNRNTNSGANEFLLMSRTSGIISLIGFDLSSVTNEIIGAELSFKIQESNRTPLSIEIVSMMHNEQNASWNEGAGNYAIRGQNATLGEATYQWRGFRDRPWEYGSEKAAVNLQDSNLWKMPATSLSGISWDEGTWIKVQIVDVSELELARNGTNKITTFGLWGTSGNGIYKISARESDNAAKLTLMLKPEEKK